MTTSNVLPKIQSIVSQVNTKRDVVDEYKQKLDAAKAELEQAKTNREKNFSFETDNKVSELESYIMRVESRYSALERELDTELPNKLREVEELYHTYVVEQWGQNEEVKELTEQTLNSFKETVSLLSQYTKKPSEFDKQLLSQIVNEDFRKAFSGQMTFIGADNHSLATALPLDYETYQKLYAAGRSLGVNLG
ncbi:hypothetical protein RJW49_03310 [Streptococcus suis]|uniref:hypothetical protein n=1 Tax=Streptococcus suis TaxID=1307 RepID=UPI000942954D|nr:hypothetical protein [Streptococcus suis]WNF74323.1 hypothetical protein RJW49_03310 [Streptococcus suis]HEL1667295.1 hypothetical protein [Streptococcus suis]HEM2533569.1 hypothetical protein [Streptococcus suis]HEM2551917.1 hypothetical protein [Streptococcus suis]HEM2558083.1 hypothetical protein [Streptococcus suis]